MPSRRAVQARNFVPVGDQPTTAALHERVYEQPVLVDELRVDQSMAQHDAAGRVDIAAGLLLQRSDPRNRFLGEDGDVLPLPLRQIATEDGKNDSDCLRMDLRPVPPVGLEPTLGGF